MPADPGMLMFLFSFQNDHEPDAVRAAVTPGQSPSRAGVAFPSADSNAEPSTTPSSTPIRPQHLPFRRISLPSVPVLNLPNRLSIASIASVDSLAEEPAGPGLSPQPPVTPSRSPVRRRTSSRPISVDGKRNVKKRELKTVDEGKEEKRKKVVEEFYETERTYVQGLDLIYSVSRPLWSCLSFNRSVGRGDNASGGVRTHCTVSTLDEVRRGAGGHSAPHRSVLWPVPTLHFFLRKRTCLCRTHPCGICNQDILWPRARCCSLQPRNRLRSELVSGGSAYPPALMCEMLTKSSLLRLSIGFAWSIPADCFSRIFSNR
jgi:hypothetical protein